MLQIGFTGTPFVDNYPTFAYIRTRRKDAIPDLIDRSFYAYTSDQLSDAQFAARFAAFQGQNSHVLVEYVASEPFVQPQQPGAGGSTQAQRRQRQQQQQQQQQGMQSGAPGAGGTEDELAILQRILVREQQQQQAAAGAPGLNALVDLCGIFKRASIHDIRDLVRHWQQQQQATAGGGGGGVSEGFHYVYHIDQADGSDRVLGVDSDTDVQFDEEFFKYLCATHGAALRERVFFFVDNRNVIGKDIPFQLGYQAQYGQPLFAKSVVLAHDVDDFSKIWQAMGRSRTMNETLFTIYTSGVAVEAAESGGITGGHVDIKAHALTRQLYVHNCDCKMAGNLSSIYQTLIALLNLSCDSFYYCDEIVNTFIGASVISPPSAYRRVASRIDASAIEKPCHCSYSNTMPV